MRKVLIVVIGILLLSTTLLYAHDKRYPLTPDQRTWFDSLASRKGPCCANADGNVLMDNEWDSKDGHYRVMIEGVWYDVPDEAVVKQPNLYGPTMVWPIRIWNQPSGTMRIEVRCFMPGMMT